MAELVNDAIVEAAKTEMAADVIRWNARRSMLDNIEAWIQATRKERDRLNDEENQPELDESGEWVNW